MKGNVYVNSFDPANSKLHNDWRQMSGEADLGLFGAHPDPERRRRRRSDLRA